CVASEVGVQFGDEITPVSPQQSCFYVQAAMRGLYTENPWRCHFALALPAENIFDGVDTFSQRNQTSDVTASQQQGPIRLHSMPYQFGDLRPWRRFHRSMPASKNSRATRSS